VRQAVFVNLCYTRQGTDVPSVLIDGMAKLPNLDDNQFQAFRDRLSSLSQSLDPLIYRHAVIIPFSADAAGAQLMARRRNYSGGVASVLALVSALVFVTAARLAITGFGPRLPFS
jgi:hypothetical protein